VIDHIGGFHIPKKKHKKKLLDMILYFDYYGLHTKFSRISSLIWRHGCEQNPDSLFGSTQHEKAWA